MTSQLKITPDKVIVRGSRFMEPVVVPVAHRWEIVCREPGLRVDEQITCLLDRLRPHTEPIAELVSRLAIDGGGAVLQVVRYFNDTEQGRSRNRPGDSDSPNLFGWHLDRHVLDFINAVGAEIDVDEYDLSPDEDAASGR